MTLTCFHCGLPAYDDRFQLTIGEAPRTFCCVGCLAAAQTILDNGLGDYYRFHDPDQTPASPPVNERDRERLLLYDRDDVQADFVRHDSDSERSATLMIEGISCAACSWLIEKRLRQLPGISQAHFNQTNHRLTVHWNTTELRLSDVFIALHALGYRAQPFKADTEAELRQKTARQYLLRLGVAGIGMMQAMMNAVALYSGNIEAQHESWLRWASLVLTVPVVIIAAGPFVTAAWRSLKARHLSMDVSVSIAILGAFFASVWATLSGGGEVYFESVNMFTFFLVLGRYLEFRARSSVHASGNALLQHLPPTCLKWTGDRYERAPVRDLTIGDRIQVLAGELCPADGTVTHGRSQFDESRLTGEFAPRDKQTGDSVLAGTLNQSQPVEVEVTRLGPDSSASSLVQLLERAASEKPRIAELADRGSRHFVLSTLIITALIGLVWWWIDPERALWVVISVLVVTCPCALSLATPTALAQATHSLRRKGLVITRGYTLDRLADITDLAFDKTGTLTEGRYRLVKVEALEGAGRLSLTEPDLIRLAAGLETSSEHPIAQAFEAAVAHGTRLPEFSDRQQHPSAGLSGTFKGGHYRLGTARFTLDQSVELTSDRRQRVWLSRDGEGLAVFTLSDEVRSTARTALDELESLGLRCHVLTGDPSRDVDSRLAELPLQGDYLSGLSAQAKLDWMHEQQRQGRQVAMVGDGINDAPVLAGAPVSIAMSSGTDLAKQASDALLLNENLRILATAIRAARKTRRIIRQNLVWALIYNGLALPLAAAGWVAPWQAAIGMSLSSLLVVGNALRLRAF